MSAWAFIAGLIIGAVVLGSVVTQVQQDPHSIIVFAKDFLHKAIQTWGVWN